MFTNLDSDQIPPGLALVIKEKSVFWAWFYHDQNYLLSQV